MPSVFRSWSPSHKWILCGFFVGFFAQLQSCQRFVLRFAFWASLLQATQTLGFWELLLFPANLPFEVLSYFETSPSFARSLSLSLFLSVGRKTSTPTPAAPVTIPFHRFHLPRIWVSDVILNFHSLQVSGSPVIDATVSFGQILTVARWPTKGFQPCSMEDPIDKDNSKTVGRGESAPHGPWHVKGQLCSNTFSHLWISLNRCSTNSFGTLNAIHQLLSTFPVFARLTRKNWQPVDGQFKPTWIADGLTPCPVKIIEMGKRVHRVDKQCHSSMCPIQSLSMVETSWPCEACEAYEANTSKHKQISHPVGSGDGSGFHSAISRSITSPLRGRPFWWPARWATRWVGTDSHHLAVACPKKL